MRAALWSSIEGLCSALVWCALTRTLIRVNADASVATGPELVASRLTPEQHRGMELFNSELPQISRQPGVAWATPLRQAVHEKVGHLHG